MPLTYSWKIIKTKKRDLSIKIGGDIVNFNNAIINIEWEKIGTDENGNSASQIGLSPMRAKRTIDPNNYVESENLTKDILVSWIEATADEFYMEKINNSISEQIEQKKSIPSITYEFE